MSIGTWTIGNLITPEFAKKCIEDPINNLLQVRSIKLFGQGFDNLAFLVNEQYIFRFPKGEEADKLLYDENRVLPKIESLFSLKIPKVQFRGNPTQRYPFHFQGYEMLQGASAYQVSLSDQDLRNCLTTLAEFLTKLHSVKMSQAQSMGAQRQRYDKTTVRRVIETMENRVNVIKEKGICELDDNFIKQQIELSRNIIISHDNDCLVHGDLDFRHLLVLNNQVSGVIDWGDVGTNHPVIDYVIVHLMFPKSMHDIFFNEYGPVAQDIWAYARFLALHRSITLILYGYDVQDISLLEASKKSYVRLRDEIAN